MLCDICHKNKVAIHIEKMVDGEKRELHLCNRCARLQQKQFFDVLDAHLQELRSAFGGDSPEEKHQEFDGQCPSCHWTFDRFEKNGGFLGCKDCYSVFSKPLSRLFRECQRGDIHAGKRPPAADLGAARMMELLCCRRELRAAIQGEDYERAATLRDRICELENAHG